MHTYVYTLKTTDIHPFTQRLASHRSHPLASQSPFTPLLWFQQHTLLHILLAYSVSALVVTGFACCCCAFAFFAFCVCEGKNLVCSAFINNSWNQKTRDKTEKK